MKTHGMYRTPTYNSWAGMKQRCGDPSYHKYKDYGARGIIYDPRWESFEEFFNDMGERPPGTTLDRYPDPNGNYCKSNCRWATSFEQSRNKQVPPSNSRVGVQWCKNRRFRDGGYWRATGKDWRGIWVPLYSGPSFNQAIEARELYEELAKGTNHAHRPK